MNRVQVSWMMLVWLTRLFPQKGWANVSVSEAVRTAPLRLKNVVDWSICEMPLGCVWRGATYRRMAS